jgi:HEAT repeat protein
VLPVGFFERTPAARMRIVRALAAETPGAKNGRDVLRAWQTGGNPERVWTLSLVVERDPDLAVRRVAFQGLARISDPVAIPGLIVGLRTPDHRTRLLAIQGIRRLRARDAVPDLIELLADRRLRHDSARALVDIRDERALAPLRAAALKGGPRTRRRLRECVHELESAVGY